MAKSKIHVPPPSAEEVEKFGKLREAEAEMARLVMVQALERERATLERLLLKKQALVSGLSSAYGSTTRFW